MTERIKYDEIKACFLKCMHDFCFGELRSPSYTSADALYIGANGYAFEEEELAYDLPVENLMLYIQPLIVEAGYDSEQSKNYFLNLINDLLSENRLDVLTADLDAEEKRDFLRDMWLLELTERPAYMACISAAQQIESQYPDLINNKGTVFTPGRITHSGNKNTGGKISYEKIKEHFFVHIHSYCCSVLYRRKQGLAIPATLGEMFFAAINEAFEKSKTAYALPAERFVLCIQPLLFMSVFVSEQDKIKYLNMINELLSETSLYQITDCFDDNYEKRRFLYDMAHLNLNCRNMSGAARQAGIKFEANVRDFDRPLPDDESRFGPVKTWGEALAGGFVR